MSHVAGIDRQQSLMKYLKPLRYNLPTNTVVFDCGIELSITLRLSVKMHIFYDVSNYNKMLVVYCVLLVLYCVVLFIIVTRHCMNWRHI